MTPGARAQMTIDILDGLAETRQPADRFVERWFRDRRFAGSGDRRFINDFVFAILRHWGELAWWSGGNVHRALVIAGLVRLQDWTAAEFAAAFDGQGHRAAELSPKESDLVQRVLAQAAHQVDMPFWAAASFPEWLEADLAERFGDDLGPEMAAMNDRAPVDLRVNTLKVNRETAQAALADEGIETEFCALSPVGLRLTTRKRVTATKAYRSGLVEVQDEAAQLASLIVGAEPGMQVGDVCAGAGGKTLVLAATMKNSGQIHAWDVDGQRLEQLDERVQRAGIRNVQSKRVTAGTAAAETLLDKLDRVLIDAPCSGTGTWRRNPETKWRFDAKTLDRQVARQRDLMVHFAPLVKPGGRLIYATCSLLNREGSEQIDWFVQKRPDFKVVPITDVWAEVFKTPCPMMGAKAGTKNGDYLNLSPAANGTDGFFAAVLQRDAASETPDD